MSDTTHEGTSDGKPCADCGTPIQGDQRFSRCPECRGAEQDGPSISTAPKGAPMNPGDPVILDIEECKPPPIEDRDFYWCGSTADCPFDVTLGGFEFPKSIGRIRADGPNGMPIMEPDYRKGVVHRMTETQKAVVLEHAANKVVRNYGPRQDMKGPNGETLWKGKLVAKTGSKRRSFMPQEGDKPLGNFVYMMKVRNETDRPVDNPPTMVSRDW